MLSVQGIAPVKLFVTEPPQLSPCVFKQQELLAETYFGLALGQMHCVPSQYVLGSVQGGLQVLLFAFQLGLIKGHSQFVPVQ